ncbi:hypothetical protein ACFL2Z_04715 [Candidatus Eisenbacteria bacterium]|uniref:Uncharacterized protein n=1 Tax=Eiseniibacteriota bacterium TaxID=2212470 RepID=A0ABV6YQN0_UNCEI
MEIHEGDCVMAPGKPREEEKKEKVVSWEDEKRRKRLGFRRKDSRPSEDSDGTKRGKRRMAKSFDDSSDAEGPRRSWRDSYDEDDGIDNDDILDLSDLDGDLEDEDDDVEDSEGNY